MRREQGTERNVAHVLRRLTFGPMPGSVDAALERHADLHDLIDALIDAEPIPFVPPIPIDKPVTIDPEPELVQPALGRHWVERMTRDQAAVHERMMWFWHNVFLSSTNGDKGNYLFLWHQLRMIHRLALTDLHAISQAMIDDAALIYYLDGFYSVISAPNENLARELMELFLLGRGNYTEADVRAGARILSGRSIDTRALTITTIPSLGPSGPDTFLGATEAFDPARMVDRILGQPAVAPHIVDKLSAFFVGGTVARSTLTAWADQFRASGYQVVPLLRTVLHSDEFLGAARSRLRSGVEWYAAAYRAAGLRHVDDKALESMGQIPYSPPNVAGWPDEARWISAGSLLSRAGYLGGNDVVVPRSLQGASVDAILRWCGVYDASRETRDDLEALRRSVADTGLSSRAVLRGVLLSPEFALA